MRKVLLIYVLSIFAIVTMNLQIGKVMAKPYVERYNKSTQYIKGYFEKYVKDTEIDKDSSEYTYEIHHYFPVEDREKQYDNRVYLSIEYKYEDVDSIDISHYSSMDINNIKKLYDDFCKPVNLMLHQDIIDLNIIERIYSDYMSELKDVEEKKESSEYVVHYEIEPLYSIYESKEDPNRKPEGFYLYISVDFKDQQNLFH